MMKRHCSSVPPALKGSSVMHRTMGILFVVAGLTLLALGLALPLPA